MIEPKHKTYKWCCLDKDFHKMLKIKAEQKGMKLIDFTHELANDANDPLKQWEEAKYKNRRLKFRVL